MQRLPRFHWPSKKTDEELGKKIVEGTAIGIGVRIASAALAAGVASAAITVVATQTSPTYHPPYALSIKGAAFITRFEGIRLRPYDDPAPGRNCTVGVGSLLHYGPCTAIELRETITYKQAIALLMRDAGVAQNCLRADITHHITQPVWDGMTSFAFNVGCGNVLRSSVLRDVNGGDLQGAARDLRRWSYAGGVFLPGLYTRRVAEGVLITTGNYGAGIGRYEPPKPVSPKLPTCGIERPGPLPRPRRGCETHAH